MGVVMVGGAVDWVDWPECEVRMIEIWIVTNLIAAALAGLRGIQSHRCERDYWRAYDDRRRSENPAVGPCIGEQGS